MVEEVMMVVNKAWRYPSNAFTFGNALSEDLIYTCMAVADMPALPNHLAHFQQYHNSVRYVYNFELVNVPHRPVSTRFSPPKFESVSPKLLTVLGFYVL